MKSKRTRFGVVFMVFGTVFLLSDSIMNAGQEIDGVGWLIDWILLTWGGIIFVMAEWRT